MFKRRVEDSGKSTIFSYACRLFFAHIANVLLMIVVGVLVENLGLIKINAPESTTSVCVTVVCFLFYVVYVYIHSWRYGQRDCNLVKYKHITYNKWKPLLAAFGSQLPGIALVLLSLFQPEGGRWKEFALYYYLDFNWFLKTAGDSAPILWFLPILFAPIISPFAYHLGYRGVYLANFLVFKTGKQDKPR